jgi:CDP-paratose 2-epimerase
MPELDAGPRRVLVTGGAGFIGSSLSVALATRAPDFTVTALDNLKRRGSELNLPRLERAGVRFEHGDVREAADLQALGQHDILVECSAEPSVLAATTDSRYAFETNLVGAYNCMELARRDHARMVFLSTSRVYPIGHLRRIKLVEEETRFEIASEQEIRGVSRAGISEDFPMDGARTLYGSTKLAAELLIAEYRDAYGLQVTVNRCGVVAGPWQMGKVDQGVFTHWVLSHYFKKPLTYIGYGGTGKQVRDVLHVEDLTDLVIDQIQNPDRWDGVTVNVGGGPEGSLSLLETTAICRELTGNRSELGSELSERPGDVPLYVSDCSALGTVSTLAGKRSPGEILADVFEWVRDNEHSVKQLVR